MILSKHIAPHRVFGLLPKKGKNSLSAYFLNSETRNPGMNGENGDNQESSPRHELVRRRKGRQELSQKSPKPSPLQFKTNVPAFQNWKCAYRKTAIVNDFWGRGGLKLETGLAVAHLRGGFQK
jgi:hypothetical protein